MKVHELLNSPDKWTQGAGARDAHGKEARFDSEAVCYCLLVAVAKCYPKTKFAILDLLQVRIGKLLTDWNDAPERTFEDVRNLCLELDI